MLSLILSAPLSRKVGSLRWIGFLAYSKWRSYAGKHGFEELFAVFPLAFLCVSEYDTTHTTHHPTTSSQSKP